MGVFIDSGDLEPFIDIEPLKADALIADVEALALTSAPCLASTDPELTVTQRAAVKAVLRQAIIRNHNSGDGSTTLEMAGPFQVQHQASKQGNLLWDSEIARLKEICASTGTAQAGAAVIDVLSANQAATVHLDICSLAFGALYCSCGADIAGVPIFEGGVW